MPETAVIDLGLDRPDLEPEPAPLSGWWSRRWRLAIRPEDSTLLLTRRDDGAASDVADEPHRLWWARSDAQLGAIEVLGVVTANGCIPHYPYLVCGSNGEGLAIWRFGG